MLADWSHLASQGALSQNVIPQGWSRIAILGFIQNELPKWRDRQDRPYEAAETRLTSQLCAHLNSAARKSDGWDCFQFRVEEGDEVSSARKMDLIAGAAGETVVVEGRGYVDFETILPIECKRLPTPVGNNRDDREYVISRFNSTGGIQRFKDGLHAAAHSQGGMIGFVQAESNQHWYQQIQNWIRDLYQTGRPGWTVEDALQHVQDDASAGVSVYQSVHVRSRQNPIQLRHIWIKL